jgi:hypothetical protein
VAGTARSEGGMIRNRVYIGWAILPIHEVYRRGGLRLRLMGPRAGSCTWSASNQLGDILNTEETHRQDAMSSGLCLHELECREMR